MGSTGQDLPKEVTKEEVTKVEKVEEKADTSEKQEKEETKVVQMGSKTQEENEVLAKARKIQEDRQKALQEEEAEILKTLGEKFELTREKIEEAVKVEEEISNPALGVNTMVKAIEFYKSKNLTENQILFLAVSANSRANVYRNQIMSFQKDMSSMQQELIMLKSSVPSTEK